MVSTLLFDLSNTLLFAKDHTYQGGLNKLHQKLRSSSDYSPLDHFYFNQELLDYLTPLRQNYSLAIFTAGTIQTEPPLRKILSSLFHPILSASLDFGGISKSDPSVYQQIVDRLHTPPPQIFFTDDTLRNVQAAAQAGYTTHHYRDNRTLFTALNQLLTENTRS